MQVAMSKIRIIQGIPKSRMGNNRRIKSHWKDDEGNRLDETLMSKKNKKIYFQMTME